MKYTEQKAKVYEQVFQGRRRPYDTRMIFAQRVHSAVLLHGVAGEPKTE